jgi:hypothetical protein
VQGTKAHHNVHCYYARVCVAREELYCSAEIMKKSWNLRVALKNGRKHGVAESNVHYEMEMETT